MQREKFNLGHYSFMDGRIGQLQTMSVIPVIGGDSITVQMTNLMRLSPLRRSLTVDAQVDYFAFYVPHRHIFGDDWETMMLAGINSAVSLSTTTPAGTSYLGQVLEGVAPASSAWLSTAYIRIWNRYFRFLKLTPEIQDAYVNVGFPTGHSAANSRIDGGMNQKFYGYSCCRLKKPWNTGIVSDLASADREVASVTVMDIVDLEQTKMGYRSEIERDRFANRYNDVMRTSYGSSVNIDADERPQLVMRQSVPLSGYDVNGTGDASLGTFSGKSLGKQGFGFRRKFFPEHGSVWIMALVRFPTIGSREQIRQAKGVKNFANFAASYEVDSAIPPAATNLDDWHMSPAGATTLGEIPFGEEWRHQPNAVHFDYEALQGFPFLSPGVLNTHTKAIYHSGADYDSIFQTTSLAHWQAQASIQVEAIRHYPNSKASIFAGVKR